MVKACKAFGIHFSGFEYENFDMVLRMEQKLQEQIKEQKSTNASAKGKKKHSMELERLKWGMNSDEMKEGVRGRYYKALSG